MVIVATGKRSKVLASHAFLGFASPLIDIDRKNQDHPNCHILPERLHPSNHEAIAQHGGDECPDNAAPDGSDSPKQAGAANNRRRNCGEIV